MILRDLRSAFAAAALLVPAPFALAAPPPAWQLEEATAAALDRALGAITPAGVEADLRFIASDELAGRDSPSPGLRIAARYLRSRLVRLGWEPGAEDGWFHEYALEQYRLDEERTYAELDGERWTLGEDYFLSRRSLGAHDATGEVIHVGELEEEELEGVELAGKWGLVAAGEGVSRRRLRAASEAGMLGLLALPDPAAETSVAEAHRPWLERMRAPSLQRPWSYGAPLLYLTEARAAELVGESGLPPVGTSLGVTLHETTAVKRTEDVVLENVCGLWPGSDPLLRNEVIIVSAHYDHVGSRENGDIYNGADDNGSGTTGLLAIADALAEYGPMRRTVLLLWVSAEEKGLLGSKAWTEDPWLPEGMQPICNLNIDMIGRNAPDEIGITPTAEHPAYNRLTEIVEAQMGAEGFTVLNSADAYWSRSDHASFSENLGIPVAFLFSDVHEDYHQPTDTADKIDCDKLARVARLVVRMLHELQADRLDL